MKFDIMFTPAEVKFPNCKDTQDILAIFCNRSTHLESVIGDDPTQINIQPNNVIILENHFKYPKNNQEYVYEIEEIINNIVSEYTPKYTLERYIMSIIDNYILECINGDLRSYERELICKGQPSFQDKLKFCFGII